MSYSDHLKSLHFCGPGKIFFSADHVLRFHRSPPRAEQRGRGASRWYHCRSAACVFVAVADRPPSRISSGLYRARGERDGRRYFKRAIRISRPTLHHILPCVYSLSRGGVNLASPHHFAYPRHESRIRHPNARARALAL